MAYPYHQEPSAPPMYPPVQPIPPVRSDVPRDDPEQARFIPDVPPRMDKPSTHSHVDTGSRSIRNDNEENTGDINNECIFNYNRYATKKTIGHGLFVIALLTSNLMQLRTLILQKQRDGIWIASVILVCVSIIIQFGLAWVLYMLGKEDIQNPQRRRKLERNNNIALVLIVLITVINAIINIFMLTVDPKSYLDARSLEILEQRNLKL